MEIKIIENIPLPEQWMHLRELVNFSIYPLEAAEKGLKNSLKCFCAYDKEKLVGLVKLQGDGITSFLVHDVIVHPDYQGRGIGKQLFGKAVDFINRTKTEGASVCLLSAKGYEPFYERFGFCRRPTETRGCGMAMDS